MTTTTAKVGYTQWNDSDAFHISEHSNNWGIADLIPGPFLCTSSTRPNTWGAPQMGRLIMETDTKRLQRWDGSAFTRLFTDGTFDWGNHSARPAASAVPKGYAFFEFDTSGLFVSDGVSVWVGPLGAGGGGGGGSGTVTSVTAANGTIIIGGTGTDPTVRVNVGTTAGSLMAGDDLRVEHGHLFPFTLGNGPVSPGTYEQRFRTYLGSIQILGVTATAGFSHGPATTNLLLDLVAGDPGVSLWPTNPSNRPTIVAGQQEVAAETVPDNAVVSGGSSIRVKVVSADATTPGSFVVVLMRWRWVT